MLITADEAGNQWQDPSQQQEASKPNLLSMPAEEEDQSWQLLEAAARLWRAAAATAATATSQPAAAARPAAARLGAAAALRQAAAALDAWQHSDCMEQHVWAGDAKVNNSSGRQTLQMQYMGQTGIRDPSCERGGRVGGHVFCTCLLQRPRARSCVTHNRTSGGRASRNCVRPDRPCTAAIANVSDLPCRVTSPPDS